MVASGALLGGCEEVEYRCIVGKGPDGFSRIYDCSSAVCQTAVCQTAVGTTLLGGENDESGSTSAHVLNRMRKNCCSFFDFRRAFPRAITSSSSTSFIFLSSIPAPFLTVTSGSSHICILVSARKSRD